MIDLSDINGAERALELFLEISKIPRGSGNTVHIAAFLEDFAKKQGLEYIRDEYDNVIIKKPASKGFDDRPTVILQGHSDIVAEKTADCKKDMEKEGVDVYRDGDFLRAFGTTLGGDDGAALAYALAILEDEDAVHPAIEAVFTTDEETGLTGATGLDGKMLSGKILINLDSEEEGVFTVGCAGGVRADLSFEAKREPFSGTVFEISVCGLTGGHSGVEIDKGRQNAIKVLAEVLAALDSPRLIHIEGGTKDNAIAREAHALITLKDEPSQSVINEIIEKYCAAEPNIAITAKKTSSDKAPLTTQCSSLIINAVCALPFGVVGMCEDIPSLPETSMNVGTVTSDDESVTVCCSLRSSKSSEKEKLLGRVKNIANEHDASIKIHGDYPGWEYKRDSRIRDVMCEVFEKMYGKPPKVVTIHAGLECGILSDKIEGLDAISLGPDNFDIHTTEEHMSIPSFVRVFEFLTEVLKKI